VATSSTARGAARLPRVQRTSVAESAYVAIRASVISGRFKAGERLVEARLAEELGVSRGPVREALRRLCEEGLLVDILHRGTFVREFGPHELVDIYNVRLGLESVAVRLMIRAGHPATRLAAQVDEMRSAARAGDIGELSALEVRFHKTLCELSDNPLLASVFRSISAHVQMAVAYDNASYDDPLQIAEEHTPILEAIDAGDETLAVRRVCEHIVCSVEPLFLRLYGAAAAAELARLLSIPE
jgi:DNA-binding GntR family transcriptional regulator